MREVHEVAARGFGAQAVAYDRARPSYPARAVGWLVQALRIGPGQRVIDLAAGTGKLTELLASAGADLIAVEPVAQMRDRLRTRLPEVPLLAGVAEELPFAAGTVDAVTVAQAFHWFDASRAMAELARVVRTGGRLGLVSNAREAGVDWLDQVWAVMERVERHAPWREQGNPAAGADDRPGARGMFRWFEEHLANDADWSGWTTSSFTHVQQATHQDVVDRILSVSHIAALPAGDQRAVLGQIRAILGEHPQTRDREMLAIGYRANVMYTERLGVAAPRNVGSGDSAG